MEHPRRSQAMVTRPADYAVILAVAFAAGVLITLSLEDLQAWTCTPNAKPSSIWTARS
jgi:hypothetical protein